jgi:cyclopropane-fatty-acyl-phospholipid synthase
MDSCIYVGKVTHKRYHPVQHEFIYFLYFFCVDLKKLVNNELDNKLFSYNKFNIFSIRDRDYLGNVAGNIYDKIMHHLNEKKIADKINNILLLTTPRFFHYVFNPVSFFYCYNKNADLVAVVVQINNTYRESHLYVIDNLSDNNAVKTAHLKKDFFVSPFNDLTGSYQFLFPEFHQKLRIVINLEKNDTILIHTNINAKKKLFCYKNLSKIILMTPFTPWLTMGRITYQALKLRFLGMKALMKPNPRSPMTIVKNAKRIYSRHDKQQPL